MDPSTVLAADTFDAFLDGAAAVPVTAQTPDPEPAPVPEPDPDVTQSDQPEEAASEAGRVLAQKKHDLTARKQSIQAQINAARREQGDAERAALAAKNELARIQAETTRLATPDTSDPKPTEDQFQDYADFVDARASWNARKEFTRLNAAEQTHRAQVAAAAARDTETRTLETAHVARYDTFLVEHPEARDLIEAASDPEDVAAFAPASRPMQDAIVRSPQGPALMLYLAEHPVEARKMAVLPPLDAFAAIIRLETTLSAAPTGPASASRRSTAPPPIKPVSGVPTTPDQTVTADTQIEDFIRLENSRERRPRV